MGLECITPSEAAKRYEAAHLDLPYSYYEDGLIGASIGFYRLYEGKNGERILLFAFSENEFPKPETSLEDLSKHVFLVSARSSADAPRWLQDAISSHQSELYRATIETRRLFEVQENTFANKQFGYRIFAIEDHDAPEVDGKKPISHYTVRYYPFSGVEEDRVDMDSQAPEGIIGQFFTKGVEIGSAPNYAEARQIMMQDYQEKIDNIWATGSPQSLVDKVIHPNLTVREFGARVRGYIRTTPFQIMLMDLGIKVLGALGGPLGGIGYTLSQAGIALKNVRNMIREDQETDKARDITESLVERGFKESTVKRLQRILSATSPERILGQRLKTEMFTDLKALPESEMRIRPEGVPLFRRLGESWATKWLLGAFQPSKGTIVRPRNDGVITVESTSGLIVHHLPGKNKAYASKSGDLCPTGQGFDLPEEVDALLSQSDYVMVSYNKHFGYETIPMSKKQFLENVYAETRNRAWVSGLYDKDKQAQLEDPNYCPLDEFCPPDISEERAKKLHRRIEGEELEIPSTYREEVMSCLFETVQETYEKNAAELSLADRRVITRALEELRKGRDRALKQEGDRRIRAKETMKQRVKSRLNKFEQVEEPSADLPKRPMGPLLKP